MAIPGYRDEPSPDRDPSAPVDVAEAEDFLRMCYAENPRFGDLGPRLDEVRAQIDATGTYTHSTEELTYGAKVAWRNASRCIGRLYWRSLVVLDERKARGADEIFTRMVRHLNLAGGTGRADRAAGAIRPVITVFAPAEPGRPHARVWNEQLIRYAGYRTPTGEVVGDPRNVDFTRAVQDLGWKGAGGAFDVLPLVIQTPQDGVRLFDLPADAVLEVPLEHPEYDWFAGLDLRWHAVPAIANMRLSIGGVDYPLAPFNGWYMGTEIGARNLADPDRYDLVPVVARAMELDTSRASTLWRDRALVELNRAVLWSFERAGVRISDHHTESDRFVTHLGNERRAGREVPADWTWIVPPISGGATRVFHRYYHEADQRPNFYLDSAARDLGRYGHLGPSPRHAAPEDAPEGAPVAGERVPVAGESAAPAAPAAAAPAVPGARTPLPAGGAPRQSAPAIRPACPVAH
ncbi:nitric oxide synthase oxygenase [Polymorphospora sp. NPDC050346]|uniref:nitric oxide synthase oxygenase n=1 Tax=Polymorphospora sp. NPDC050346 TaxID=3155780 RepID=UPI0033D6A629